MREKVSECFEVVSSVNTLIGDASTMEILGSDHGMHI